ncbi:unnamed protein product [Caenorhabditis auriculariae]|uniref:Uncharacterized protein n=1 Tax=Caenorhabditis auriculariae TaxID=2777116 RepID=A0A8S1GZN1_9PELO|nr:unnamed protein product [Caenorhabditis auriculariae]
MLDLAAVMRKMQDKQKDNLLKASAQFLYFHNDYVLKKLIKTLDSICGIEKMIKNPATRKKYGLLRKVGSFEELGTDRELKRFAEIHCVCVLKLLIGCNHIHVRQFIRRYLNYKKNVSLWPRGHLLELSASFTEPLSKVLAMDFEDQFNWLSDLKARDEGSYMVQRSSLTVLLTHGLQNICVAMERAQKEGVKDYTYEEKCDKFFDYGLLILSKICEFGYYRLDIFFRGNLETEVRRFVRILKLVKILPFHSSRFMNSPTMIRIFSRAGANINAKNSIGQTALEVHHFNYFVVKRKQYHKASWLALHEFVRNGARVFVSQNDEPLLVGLNKVERMCKDKNVIAFNSFITLKDMAARAMPYRSLMFAIASERNCRDFGSRQKPFRRKGRANLVSERKRQYSHLRYNATDV